MPTGATGASLTLLIDTHVLAWLASDPGRVSEVVREQVADPNTALHVSGCTAWEYADLHHRGRLPRAAHFSVVADALDLVLLDTPAELWRWAARLPDIHRDPMDRILIAHAIAADLTLVTADATVRAYPVRTLW